MTYSRRLSETEAEDFSNEQAEKRFDYHGDNFEPASMADVVQGLFDESPDELESDGNEELDSAEESPVPSNEIMFPYPERDNYNKLENYGT